MKRSFYDINPLIFRSVKVLKRVHWTDQKKRLMRTGVVRPSTVNSIVSYKTGTVTNCRVSLDRETLLNNYTCL